MLRCNQTIHNKIDLVNEDEIEDKREVKDEGKGWKCNDTIITKNAFHDAHTHHINHSIYIFPSFWYIY